jgi:hypothetical protein
VAVFHRSLLVCMCLGFTGAGVAWADDAHPETPNDASSQWIDNPYAPHHTTGALFRLGTVVGGVDTERLGVTGLGVMAELGHRWGRFSLASDYTYLQFQERGPSDLRLGTGLRVGMMGRFDVIRLDSHVVGPNTMVAVFVEGGADVAWNYWYRPGFNEPGRIVPNDTKHVEAVGGFGIEIDHRLQESHGIKRIGWTLGIRVAGAPHDSDSAMVCRTSGTSCREMPVTSDQQYTDRSMMFQSSLGATW